MEVANLAAGVIGGDVPGMGDNNSMILGYLTRFGIKQNMQSSILLDVPSDVRATILVLLIEFDIPTFSTGQRKHVKSVIVCQI